MVRAAHEPPGFWRRPAVWVAVYALVLLASSLAPSTPRLVGLWHDDATYWLIGKNLVDGGGYRDPHSPSPISIGKYPPGVPLLCSAAWTLTGSLDGALIVVRAVMALLLAGALYAYIVLLLREGGAVAAAAPLLAIVIGCSPLVLGLALVPMSEVPTLFLTLVGILVFERAASLERWPTIVLLAAIAFAAVLVRTPSITFVAAIALTLWWRGLRQASVRFLLVVGPAIVGLHGLLRAYQMPAPGYEAIGVYGLPYGRLLLGNLGELPSYAWQNAVQILGFVAIDLLLVVFRWGPPPSIAWPVLWVVALGVPLLAARGIFVDRRTTRVPLHRTYLMLALLLIPVWPFEPDRFLFLVLPLVLLEAVRGANALGGKGFALAFASLSAASVLAAAVPNSFVHSLSSYAVLGRPVSLAETLPDLDDAMHSLPSNAIVSSSLDTMLGARYGVRGVFAWDVAHVMKAGYGAGRAAWAFYLPVDERARAKALYTARDDVRRQFATLGVTHVVLLPRIGQHVYEVLLRTFVKDLEREGRSKAVHVSAGATVEIWSISP